MNIRQCSMSQLQKQNSVIGPTINEHKQIHLLIKCSCDRKAMIWKEKDYLDSIPALSKPAEQKCSLLRHCKKGKMYCSICQVWLCEDCLLYHGKTKLNHLLIDFELNLSFFLHKRTYTSFCDTCKT